MSEITNNLGYHAWRASVELIREAAAREGKDAGALAAAAGLTEQYVREILRCRQRLTVEVAVVLCRVLQLSVGATMTAAVRRAAELLVSTREGGV